MKRDLVKELRSSFLSCGKDYATIIRKLFVESGNLSDELKRLLVINTRDCLDNKTSQVYNDKLKDMNVTRLREDGYIKLEPKLDFDEHEEIKSYIMISCDSFTANATNPEFRDCIVNFDVICNTDYWDVGDYRLRPIMICGYIDGILNKTRLSGIGLFQFLGCNELVLNEDWAGYSIFFSAVHGSDDLIPPAPLQ